MGMGRAQFPYTGISFFKFARQQLVKDEVRPFLWGGLIAFASLGGLSLGGTPEQRKESKYLYPPKH